MRLRTKITARSRAGIPARMSAWIGWRQRDLSARVHAAGDERARQQGWEITKSTGRFGFGARTYRDPRFDDRRRQFLPPADGSRSHSQAVPAAAAAAFGDPAWPPVGRVKSTACAVARADQRAVHALRERKCDGG
jgi:hypothetical protein